MCINKYINYKNMSRKKWTDEQLIQAVKDNLSYAGVIVQLGLIPAGGNYDSIKRKISELNLDISHFTGKAWNQGERYRPIKEAIPLNEVLIENSTWINTNNLKLRLLKEGIKEHKCECCNNIIWMEQPIPLELHHINGIKNDLRIENLQILCPNCHAYTDNYRGKKLKIEKEINPKPLIIKEEIKKYCKYCNKELVGKSKRNECCSVECSRKLNGSKRPILEELIEVFKEKKSFLQVGKYYEVSDNAVRKWCKFYGVLDTIKQYL